MIPHGDRVGLIVSKLGRAGLDRKGTTIFCQMKKIAVPSTVRLKIRLITALPVGEKMMLHRGLLITIL
jgi:hypothetical protein